MIFSDKTYTVLKWLCMVVLPSVAALTSAVMSLWNLATPETIAAITGTLSAVAAFIGALIGVSTAEYNRTK